MKKLVSLIVILFSVSAHGQTYLAHKTPIESILAPSNQQISPELFSKAQQECFDHLSTEIILNRKVETPDSEADVVLKNLTPENTIKSKVIIDPVHNGFSAKSYILKGLKNVSDEQQHVYLSAFTAFGLNHFQDTISHKNYDQVTCWVERYNISNGKSLGIGNTHLALIDGDGTDKLDMPFYRYDFNDDIKVPFYMSLTAPNVFVGNAEKVFKGPAISGMEHVYYFKIPETIWIDDDFENRFAPVENFKGITLDMRNGNYKNYPLDQTKYSFSEFGFKNAKEKYSFYF